MKIAVVLFIACSFLNCSQPKNVTLYVTNINEAEQSINLKAYVNDSLCVNSRFKYSTTTPNYDVFEYKFNKGDYTLRVLVNEKELLKDTFNLKTNMFIFISYGRGSEDEGRIFLKKTTINYKLH